MEVVPQKTTITLNLRSDLTEVLNKEAADKHLPLELFIETLLTEVSFNKPNKETIKAIKELQSGQSAGVLDVTSFAAFTKSLEVIK